MTVTVYWHFKSKTGFVTAGESRKLIALLVNAELRNATIEPLTVLLNTRHIKEVFAEALNVASPGQDTYFDPSPSPMFKPTLYLDGLALSDWFGFWIVTNGNPEEISKRHYNRLFRRFERLFAGGTGDAIPIGVKVATQARAFVSPKLTGEQSHMASVFRAQHPDEFPLEIGGSILALPVYDLAQ